MCEKGSVSLVHARMVLMVASGIHLIEVIPIASCLPHKASTIIQLMSKSETVDRPFTDRQERGLGFVLPTQIRSEMLLQEEGQDAVRVTCTHSCLTITSSRFFGNWMNWCPGRRLSR